MDMEKGITLAGGYKGLIADDCYKVFLDPNKYAIDSFKLADEIIRDRYKPDFVFAIGMGGFIPFPYVVSRLEKDGKKIERESMFTDSYRGIGKRANVRIGNLTEIMGIINGKEKGFKYGKKKKRKKPKRRRSRL